MPEYSGFSRVMLVGLLNVAVFDRPVIVLGVYCVEDVRPELEGLGLLNFQKWNLRTTDKSGIAVGQYRNVIAARLHLDAAGERPRYSRSIVPVKPAATPAAEAGAQNRHAGKVRRTGYVDIGSVGLVGGAESIGRSRLHRQNRGNLPVLRELVNETASACNARGEPDDIGLQEIRYRIQGRIQGLVRRLIGPEYQPAVLERVPLGQPGVALELEIPRV